MLLNLSNHPSSGWPDSQLAIALKQYTSVQDLPFPQIPPAADTNAVRELVDEYEARILKIGNGQKEFAVHLMGEMTFTFALVQRLKAAGIPCVASTTHRHVEERDGRKIVRFEFVQFRPY